MCSWNIHLGIELTAILSTIEQSADFQNLDVLLLQEASQRDGLANAVAIAAALGPAYRGQQRAVDRFHGHRRGLGIVWNSDTVDLDRFELLPLPRLHECSVSPWQRYSLRPLGMRPRAALMAEGTIAGGLGANGQLRIYVVHLSPVGFAFQAEQLAVLQRDNEHRAAAAMVIVAGDFNSLRVDRRKWRRWLDLREVEGFVEASKDVQWTYWSNALPIRQKLDNALVLCRAKTTCAAWAPEVRGSDHLPLFFSIGDG